MPAGGLSISKDPEINSAVRHDLAIETLGEEFDLDDPGLDGDAETLGIAGGILKRRWQELGQLRDLKQAAEYYRRGAVGDDLGDDACAHIDHFLEDPLAEAGDEPDERRRRASDLRERILRDLPVLTGNWFNAATRAEAYVGLGLFEEATAALQTKARPAPWELETTARQLATLAHIREEKPMAKPEVRRLFETLLGGSAEATRSALVGKVGLALSGGGFRASFYHLGVLARLAELDVLRNVEVLSCVSGGSIVGACYWLALRKQLENPETAGQVDYIELVRVLIDHFERAVAADLRDQVQLSTLRTVWQMLRGAKGAMDPQKTASACS
ncbi:MAG: tetratricopeptide repeat-containing protein [Desulfobacterales bacterium]|nr:tetratricopeptide repeat-containing protein [Desulfobacterales bacterium]